MSVALEQQLLKDLETIYVLDAAVTLVVPESPTTGYRWSIAVLPSAVRVVSNDFRLEASSSNVGAAGSRRIQVIVDAIGEWEVRLVLVRAWESEKEPSRTITCRLVRLQ
jgi:predicted secreted protein